MRTISFYYDVWFHYSVPITEHSLVLRCVPPELPEQQLLEVNLSIEPEETGGAYGRDSFGNQTYTARIPEPHQDFRYRVSGVALRDDSRRQVEMPLSCYSFASPLTEPSPAMEAFLGELHLTGTAWQQAQDLSVAVHHHLSYVPSSTTVETTAAEAFSQKKGVCQDYAHVFIALARLAGIPARYVAGLPEGEGQSHAWVEIWDRGYWRPLDPTRNCPVDESYLKLCVGRDFADCPVEQGTFYGLAEQQHTVYMKVDNQ